MSEEKCADCRFWLNHDAERSDLGECHRFPPRMAMEREEHRIPDTKGVMRDVPSFETNRPQDGGWPMTFPDDWCGEFERRRSVDGA